MEEYLELWVAFIVCLVLAGVYAVYAMIAIPGGGQPFGHFIGIVGMVLMLVTETLYTLRKRIRWLHWLGPLRLWLSFHIFTGIIGPFLVLLHSAFLLGGIAGFAMIMTGIVVASGFVGRYIYTAVPRTRTGIEVSSDELAARAAVLQKQLDEWMARKPAVANVIAMNEVAIKSGDWLDVLARAWQDRIYDQQVRQMLSTLDRTERARLSELQRLLHRRRQLERQIAALDVVHRMMGVWRLIHVPLGATLFTAAFIHVIATLFFKGPVF